MKDANGSEEVVSVRGKSHDRARPSARDGAAPVAYKRSRSDTGRSRAPAAGHLQSAGSRGSDARSAGGGKQPLGAGHPGRQSAVAELVGGGGGDRDEFRGGCPSQAAGDTSELREEGRMGGSGSTTRDGTMTPLSSCVKPVPSMCMFGGGLGLGMSFC